MKSTDYQAKIDKVLDSVYNAGYDVAGLRAVGESGGIITSDSLYKAKQEILALLDQRAVDELENWAMFLQDMSATTWSPGERLQKRIAELKAPKGGSDDS